MSSATAVSGVSGSSWLPLGQRLRELLSAEPVVDDLRRYFGISLAPGEMPFTGSRFEHLAGGGDRPDVADRITAQDLIAVQTLSVTVPAPVALELLEGRLGVCLSGMLSEIPAGLDMADADTTHLKPGSPAYRAWELLVAQHGVGWVTAGKLLARKRPRLLPVYDDVVRCALGHPADFWLTLHAALRGDDRAVHRSLVTLRQVAGIPETVSVLRVCDVAVWMRHRIEHRNCP